MKTFLNLLGGVLLLAGLAGFGVYLWEYFGELRMPVVAHADQVRPGMTTSEVAALWGQPDESLNETWQDDEGWPWVRRFYINSQFGWFVVRTRTRTVDFLDEKVATWPPKL